MLYHAAMDELARLARLRQNRVRPTGDRPISADLAPLERALRARHKAIGGVGVAWAQVAPKDLSRAASPVSLTRGVLKVRVLDAATAHKMDRWLRAGGLDALIDAAPGQLKRVRLTQ
jgi:hypothetical protein